MAGTGSPGRKFVTRLSALAAVTAALAVALPTQARAQIGSDRYSSIVVDAATGNVLEAANPDAPRHPASLAKLMTLYMAFEALRDRRITIQQLVPISPRTAATEPTKLGLTPGTRLTVEEAILGLVTKSANDAAAALGELLGGSEDRFAQMMTLRARALGMSRTTFTNASGLPDPDQWSTARDLAILARHLLTDFPGFYPYFSTHSFTFRRRVIFNHDRMLQSYPGADGMKTGYTEASGHNLVTSAVHSGVRLIGVVLGASSNPERDAHMATLLDQGFEQLDVPPERRTAVANRLPSLVGTAHAASLAAPSVTSGGACAHNGIVDDPGRQLRQRACGARGGIERTPRGRRRRGPHRASQPARPDHLACAGHRADAPPRRRAPARLCHAIGRHAWSCVPISGRWQAADRCRVRRVAW